MEVAILISISTEAEGGLGPELRATSCTKPIGFSHRSGAALTAGTQWPIQDSRLLVA